MVEGINAEIVCDGSNQIGFGHIRRCISLARHLQGRNGRVSIRCLSEEGGSHIPQDLCAPVKASVIIFDCPYDISEQISSAKNQGQVTVTLDGNHQVGADLNILVFDHAGIESRKRKEVGFEYVIIRNDILEMGPKAVITDSYVLVCVGGGDFLGQSHETARFLASLGIRVDLILGPLVPEDADSFETELIHTHRNPSNFAQLMADCDWAVANGGGTLFELLYLKKPCWSLPQTPAEERVAHALKECGSLLGVGFTDLMKVDSKVLAERKKNLNFVIDGRGLQRIAELIEGMVQNAG